MTSRALAVLAEESLPPFYQTLIHELLPGPIPREDRATCSSCAMIPLSDPPSPDTPAYSFHSQTKCCTYLPEIPNYLVGAILADTDVSMALGRQTVLNRIVQGGGVSVTGLNRTSIYETAYTAVSSGGGFGRSPALVCPHYSENTGACGVWKYRNSVCSTWFCKHSRGAVGSEFWGLLKRLLVAIECHFSLFCALEAGATCEMLSTFLSLRSLPASKRVAEELVMEMHEKMLIEQWRGLIGNQQEFFIACYSVAQKATWMEIRDLCGPEVRVLEGAVLAAYGRLMATVLPSKAKFTYVSGRRIGMDWYQITTYGAHDPLAVPIEIWDILPTFDGRYITETLASMPEDVARQLTETGMLRRLFDYRVIVANDE